MTRQCHEAPGCKESPPERWGRHCQQGPELRTVCCAATRNVLRLHLLARPLAGTARGGSPGVSKNPLVAAGGFFLRFSRRCERRGEARAGVEPACEELPPPSIATLPPRPSFPST